MKKNQATKLPVTAKAKAKAANTEVKTKSQAEKSLAIAAKEPVRQGAKQSIIIDMLKAPTGATVVELAEATGWQKHSVQGAMSGALKKKLGFIIISAKEEKRGRIYRITGGRA